MFCARLNFPFPPACGGGSWPACGGGSWPACSGRPCAHRRRPRVHYRPRPPTDAIQMRLQLWRAERGSVGGLFTRGYSEHSQTHQHGGSCHDSTFASRVCRIRAAWSIMRLQRIEDVMKTQDPEMQRAYRQDVKRLAQAFDLDYDQLRRELGEWATVATRHSAASGANCLSAHFDNKQV